MSKVISMESSAYSVHAHMWVPKLLAKQVQRTDGCLAGWLLYRANSVMTLLMT